ncbi:hypothetical protein HDU81_006334 [Chytriomyces hyalinus]|nr:hypothetical protein HDU81_006334 [Chytriomyces hyalinus]
MKQAALILATSYSDALESNLAQTVFQFFGFHNTGNEAMFEDIVSSSDSVTRGLLNVLMETLSSPFSATVALNHVPAMTPQEIAVLSRALGSALSMSQQPKSEILRTLSQLSDFAKTLSLAFKSGAIQIPSQTGMKALKTSESKEDETLSHLKTALFSFVMVSRILVQTINKQMRLRPNGGYDDEEARFRSTAFHLILHGLFDLHFVTCRFGLDAFPEWKDVFYGALDGSLSQKNASSADAFLIQFMPKQDVDGLPHFALPRTLFYVLVVQHALPYLDPKFLSEKVLAPITPHLTYKSGRSPDELDLFEMGHWIIFKLLNDMIIQDDQSIARWQYKGILFGMASEYAGLLLQNFDSGDSVESTKRMFTALIKALSCFSSAHKPSHTNEDSSQHNRYNEIQLDSAATASDVSSSGLPLEGARMGQRGGVRSFSAGVTGGSARSRQSFEKAESEEEVNEADVIESDEWNPWEGDEIGWACVCNLVGKIDDCTRVILEAERDRQDASRNQNDVTWPEDNPDGLNVGKDSNLRGDKMTRLEEVFLAAPFMKEWIKRDGLMTILFSQLRAVGLIHLPKLQECIRSLLLFGISDVMSIEPNLNDGQVGIGLDVPDMSKSQLWTALFEVVSGDLFYDHVRQVKLVEWYMALVAETRLMIADRKAKKEKEEKERREKGIRNLKSDVIVRAKLLIDHAQMPVRVLITDCPPSQELLEEVYLPVLAENRVQVLIRLCEPTYATAVLEAAGVRVIDTMAFTDGTSPPQPVLADYRALIDTLVAASPDTKPTIAVHCVSGIGRAPIFAIIPLVDAGVERIEAVEFVRMRRRGAFNKSQLEWIMDERNGLVRRKKPNLTFGGWGGGSKVGTPTKASSDSRNSMTSVQSERISVTSSATKKKGGFLGLFSKKG